MTTTEPDICRKIGDLRAERDQLTAEQEADPVRAADDLAQWHARDEHRRRRTLEIEQAIRDYEQFGGIVDTHGDALRSYLATARLVERRNAHVIKRRSYEIEHDYSQPGDGVNTDIEKWFRALVEFARQLPQDRTTGHTERSRIILTREAERWFRLRDSWLVASAILVGRGWVPSPEIGIGGELPVWMRWGAHRIPVDEPVVEP